MNIILGYWLDSAAYPDALGSKEASEGTVVTGFKRLIGILETQLGLTSPEISENLRIAEWQEKIGEWLENIQQGKIHSYDTGDIPFLKSFEIDSWNTAKELLHRRDELVLAGFEPQVHKGGSKWIDIIGELELSEPNKTYGFPDRVRAVLKKLQTPVQLHIDKITIVDEDEGLWEQWSIELIDLLKNHVQVLKESPLCEEESQDLEATDLHLLQSVLAGKEPSEKLAQGDGSLLLIHSEQEWDAADFLISWLQEKGSENTVLIKGEDSLFLDELLHQRGVSAIGTDTASKWRTVFQVLPLVIDTYWKPLRVDAMIDLLTIPTSPVPSIIRYKLAEALASAPGIGNKQWENAIEEGKKKYEKLWEDDGYNEKQIKKRRKELDDKLNLFVHHEYYDPIEGIPYEKLIEICTNICQWTDREYGIKNDRVYVECKKYVEEVIKGIESLGVNQIPKLQVGRILESVLGEGARLSNYSQEASKWQVVNHPGQIWGEADIVLWWGFYKNMSGSSKKTWSSEERRWLRDQEGINWTEEDVQQRRETASWRKAVRLAGKKLVLFAPAKVKGDETSVHPFWDEIQFAVAKGDSKEKALTLKKIKVNATEIRKAEKFSFGEDVFERVILNERNIPAPIRNWKIPEKTVQPLKEESATSFSKLIDCPLKWTYEYAANIRTGNVLSTWVEPLMLGNFGHAILEEMIEEKSSWDREDVKKRVGELFDELIPKLAAPLSEPKNRILREETRDNLQKSLQKFFEMLKETGIQIKYTEMEIKKPLPWSEKVDFKGRLDLVGETKNHKKILFDAKWTKKPNSYKEKLGNRSVQLALYHWLLQEDKEEELPAAYFMLRKGEIFGLPHVELPSEYHVHADGPSFSESYESLRKDIEREWSLLSEGTAVAYGIPPKAGESGEVADEQVCKYCEYKNLCGLRRVK